MNKKESFIGFLIAAIVLLIMGLQSCAINKNNKTIRRLEQELVEKENRK